VTIQQGNDSRSSDSSIDNIIDYLKERIESPFLMSFLVSWSVINRDFLFYLFLSSESDKYLKLADWDFSVFFLWWYCPFGDSLIFPLLYAVVLTLGFSPVSMFFSGSRYYLSSHARGFAQKNKSKYDNIVEIGKSEYELEILRGNLSILNAKVSDVKKELDDLSKVYSEKTEQVEERGSEIAKLDLLDLFADVAKGLKFAKEYRLSPNNYMLESLPSMSKLSYESIVDIEITSDNGNQLYYEENIFIAEFIVDDIFDFHKFGIASNAKHFIAHMRVGDAEQLDTKLGATNIKVLKAQRVTYEKKSKNTLVNKTVHG